jgi:hypothetical protein
MKLKRYGEVICHWTDMLDIGEREDGEFVMYEDHKALEDKYAKALKALSWYAEGGEFRLGFDNGSFAMSTILELEGPK